MLGSASSANVRFTTITLGRGQNAVEVLVGNVHHNIFCVCACVCVLKAVLISNDVEGSFVSN